MGARRIRLAEVTAAMPLLAPEPGEDAVRRVRALDAMVDDAVIRDWAARARVTVDEAQVEAAIAQVAAARGRSVDDLLAELEAQHVTRALYRSLVESQVLRAMWMVSRHDEMMVPEAEIEMTWRSRSDTTATLAEAHDRIRDELRARRAACVERDGVESLRRAAGAQMLVERPSVDPRVDAPHFVALDVLRIEGNVAIPRATLAGLLRISVHAPATGPAFIPLGDDGRLPPEALATWTAAYLDRGYLDAHVDNPPEATPPCALLVDHAVARVSEGARYRIGRFEYQELDAHDQPVEPTGGLAVALARLGVRSNDWFARGAMARGLEAQLHAVRAAGFGAAAVTPELTERRDVGRVDVRLVLRRGEPSPVDAHATP